jgi:electron transfer flavoprotein beta subunit
VSLKSGIKRKGEKLEIIVLLKRVPATESMIGVADDGKSIKTDDLKWVVNPYDEFAVEEALKIRQTHGGTVTILSMGTDKTVESIRTALAMGADKGILINDPATANYDSLGTARVLAAAIKTLPYDLIIAGMRAVDDDNYQVGPAVAEYLGIPHVSMVIKEDISDGKIKCHRTVEGGTFVVEASLPALFTTQRGLNEPRYASLPGIMKAKKKPLEIKTLADIGLTTDEIGKPKTTVVGMSFPPERAGGKIIDGESAGFKAAALVKALMEEARVL